ncbi:MAG: alanine--tRNA ligase [Planctomycetota bacterium]|jgi:alanyl-tRNA synthetase
MLTSNQIRRQFLDFFASKAHEIVDSSPVVPHEDPTLMFTNAGMNQFKDVFLATGTRDYRRAADTQKCIRAGGKHNDLDDVGRDTYHHTFFEMLGNWSFGDYFKQEAIVWAWELLTDVWGIDPTRLHATYFEGDADEGLEPDDEAATLWRENTGIHPDHVHPGNKKDNFWEMGDTGPCGPCSELHIDLTPDKSGASLVNAGDARVIELWNLVFIQFNRGADKKLTPLPAKHVDTGMGFERISAVLQAKLSNYDTDVFGPIFQAIRQRTGVGAYQGTLPDAEHPGVTRAQVMLDVSYRVIADHIRCLTFAITDGAMPSNEGRGYVLRRILRRAVRYGRQYMGMHEPFLNDLVPALVDHMGNAFPELRDARGGKNVEHVRQILRDEEDSFGRTFDRGLKLFREEAEYARRHHHGRISGEAAFKLHDTFGFIIDLTEQMAEEDGFTVDIGEYERLMADAREKARSAGRTAYPTQSESWLQAVDKFGETDSGPKYDDLSCEATIKGWSTEEGPNESTIQAGATAAVVLDRTSFYAEQGGQVGDSGMLRTDSGEFEVVDTQLSRNVVMHVGTVMSGYLEVGQRVSCQVAPARRPIMQNHTSTHILNWALREVLGDHVQQKGSLVDAEKTRFDFSHNKPVSDAELARIEALCAEQVAADHRVYVKDVDQQKAREICTLRAVFGEKYPDVVRVVSIGADIDQMLGDPGNEQWMKYSVEFCGGTHLQRSGEARRFVLTSEEGVAKGVRRVIGISGDAAEEAVTIGTELLEEVGKNRQSSGDELRSWLSSFQNRVADAAIPVSVRHQIRETLSDLQKKAKAEEKAAAAASGGAVKDCVATLFNQASEIGGVCVVTGEVPTAGADALRTAIDWVRNKTDASAVFLATGSEEKVIMIAGMSKEVVGRGVKAGDLIKEVAPLVGGRGGGRPDMAQGGGDNPSGIGNAVDRARTWIEEKLG